MDKATFNQVFTQAVNELRKKSPKRTGHLAFNAIKGEWIKSNHYRIYIDSNVLINEPNIDGDIAGIDYQAIINEKPSYKTYKWFDNSVRFIAQYIANQLGGKIE